MMDSTHVEPVVQQHIRLTQELREIEDEFNRQEQHELAAMEAAKDAIDAEWQEEQDTMISQLRDRMPSPETWEKILADKRDARRALEDSIYQRKKAERQRRLEDDKLKLDRK